LVLSFALDTITCSFSRIGFCRAELSALGATAGISGVVGFFTDVVFFCCGLAEVNLLSNILFCSVTLFSFLSV